MELATNYLHEKENNKERSNNIKYLNFFTSASTRRCGECKNTLTDQVNGIDGALCDLCVESVAPWMNETVDPYLMALWSMGGYGYSSYDHAYLGIDEPF